MQQSDYTYTNKMDELRLDISHPNNHGKVFILLEGDSDIRLYRKLCNEYTTRIEVIPGGKLKLEQGLAELSLVYPQLLGIRDADFLHLEAINSTQSNLFLTDYHDMEMLIASCDKTFSAVIYEFCDDLGQTHSHLKQQFLKAIAFIGYCRWYNEIKNVELNFKGVHFGDLFNVQTFKIDETAYLSKLLTQSPRARYNDIATILNAVKALEDTSHDLLQLCNGHDFMKVLALYITSKPQNRGITDNQVSTHFRIAYHLESFKATNLYTATSSWATEKGYQLY
ncbi:MAG: hypothetical protein RLZZ292_1906 [Bacteroidota bacterium]|jgi:hypothetical protein